MAAIDYARMTRVCTRVRELAEEPTTKSLIKQVYADRTRAEVEEYLAADAAMAAAEGTLRKEAREAAEALAEFDQPFREARAVLTAYHPDATLPETLKVLKTDTDRKNAVERLVDAVDDHVGATWADELLAGPFGQRSSALLKELDDAITANSALAEARDRRAKAYGLAYERYIAFKNVVRNTYGAKSPQYRRIHVRADGSAGDEAVVPAPVVPTPTGGG
jgi:hypothetical protein